MKERIEAIIQHERLTPSQFADSIGVQRSGISHILSGRNKPSLDFLNKLLKKYPHISGDWLITGEGSMLSGLISAPKVTEQLSFPESADTSKTGFKMPKKVAKDEAAAIYNKKKQDIPVPPPTQALNSDKKIERIVVFYSDKTFSDYRPE